MKLSTLASAAALVALAGCSTVTTFLPHSGPSASDVLATPEAHPDSGIRVVDISDGVTRRILSTYQTTSFSSAFGQVATPPQVFGTGDTIEITVWEAPPAALFGTSTTDNLRGTSSTTRVAVLPEQVVSDTGTVNVPFAGTIRVVGRSTDAIEKDIVERLRRKANDPQVLVRLVRNNSSMVTVVGEVNTTARVPLSPRGERLLDALAASGGFRQPVNKITIQVTRQVTENGRRVPRVISLPLERVITDPEQNIPLQAGDVITAVYQTNSLTVLGATVRNEELNFEAQGISLAQALARAGGLRDERANPLGVFIFRLEDPAAVGDPNARTTPDGRVPVVYRLDLKDPAAFFVAQSFPMRNRDMMYVANAPSVEFQKFLALVGAIVIPAGTVNSFTN